MTTVDPRATLVADTLRALLAPRRLVPILLVSAPLVVAQHRYSRDPGAVLVGLAMCLVFALVAPSLWRVSSPRGAAGLLLYGGVGAVAVAALGLGVPALLGVGPTFLTERESLLVALALFWVGGWGLGRDIEFEAGLARERARGEALAREAERAQLLALRGQLDPHFLFNTLNAIAEWCRTDGEVAERAVLQLSSMLRTILAGVPLAAWPLQRELDLCRDLFALHLIRDPNLFTLTVTGDPGDLQVPPLILLPLAENAVKHGPAAGHRGPIALALSRGPDGLTLTLDNPGPYRGPRPGSEGLPTVHKRLALAYPDGRAALTLAAHADGTRATLHLPLARPAVRT